MVLLDSLKIPMLDRHTLMEKMDVSRVSTHHRDDEVEETKTISSLSGRLSETKHERFEREWFEFFPLQVLSIESKVYKNQMKISMKEKVKERHQRP